MMINQFLIELFFTSMVYFCVFTDVKFPVHKVILVSCSDYFRSMFTSGMKECKQTEIELKGITSKGLEKVNVQY